MALAGDFRMLVWLLLDTGISVFSLSTPSVLIRTWHVVLVRHAGRGHVIWTSVASSKFLDTVCYLLLYVWHDCCYLFLYSLVLFWMKYLRLKLGKFRLMETKDCLRMISSYQYQSIVVISIYMLTFWNFRPNTHILDNHIYWEMCLWLSLF